MTAAADVYQRIREVILEHKENFVHPEYPDTLLRERLDRFLPRLPFYLTDNYAVRIVYRDRFLFFDQLVNIGKPSARELGILIAWCHRLGRHIGTAGRAETFGETGVRRFGELIEREDMFLIANLEAVDPWDAVDAQPTYRDPHQTLRRHHAGRLHGVELSTSVLATSVYFPEPRNDILDLIELVSRETKALVVGTFSHELTHALRERMAAQAMMRTVGAVRTNFIFRLPKSRSFIARYQERYQGPLPIKFLLGDRIDEFDTAAFEH
jgi:hypothetical protein